MFRQKAKELIHKYQTNNPFQLARDCHIKLLYADLGNLKGLYQYYKRAKVILINQSLSDSEKREVCAHELGHALLHPRANRFFLHRSTFQNCDRMEREANLFAAYLLIPDMDAFEFFQKGYTVSEISALTGVSVPLVEERMNLFLKENAKSESQKADTDRL